MGRRIREGFVPGEKTSRLISADYSQIELRIMAHLSGDPVLREAFLRGDDIHRDTAARVFDVLPQDVTAEMRRRAKVVNFGVIYGISAFGLAKNLGISNAEAADYIEHYFAEYAGVRQWIERTLEQARDHGYVVTMFNRRRYVPEINTTDTVARKAAERVVINTPVQGSAADVIKLAMVRLDKALEGSGSRIVLQVHDELLVEGPAEHAETTAGIMKEIMEHAAALDVPLKVDIGVGRNWAEIHS
jgi:DNA polymerase-1